MKRCERQSIIVILLLLLLHSTSIFAQDARRTMLLTTFTENTAFNQEQTQVIRESLLLQLQRGVDSIDFILPVRRVEHDTDAFDAARLNGADSLLFATVSGDMEAVSIDFVLWDVLEMQRLDSLVLEGFIDRRYRNIFGGFWHPVIELLAKHLAPVQNYAMLTIQSLQDANVSISGIEGTKHSGDSGKTEFTVAVPANYSISVSKSHYFTEEIPLFISTDSIVDVSEKQIRLPNFFLKMNLIHLSYPTLSAGLYFFETQVALYGGLSLYQLGIQPFQKDDSHVAASLFESLPLFTLNAGISYRLDSLPLPFRTVMFLSAQSSLRILTQDRWSIDDLFPFEFLASCGLSHSVSRFTQLKISIGASVLLSSDGAYANKTDLDKAILFPLGKHFFLSTSPVINVALAIGWSL